MALRAKIPFALKILKNGLGGRDSADFGTVSLASCL